MKRAILFLAVLVLILLVFPPKAKAEYIDLAGADIIGQPMPCPFDGQVRGCVLVEKDNKKYQVVFDAKGEYKIFQVEIETRGGRLFVVKPILLWARGAI